LAIANMWLIPQEQICIANLQQFYDNRLISQEWCARSPGLTPLDFQYLSG
jgi:hypothetical protein